jgi:hypothetical protein
MTCEGEDGVELSDEAFRRLSAELDHAYLVRLWLIREASRLGCPITIAPRREGDNHEVVPPESWSGADFDAWVSKPTHSMRSVDVSFADEDPE